MIDKKRIPRISKVLAHALRHAPDEYHIVLDELGWTAVDDLLMGVARRRPDLGPLSRADLEMVLAQPGKRRYEMADGRIRALYGHSVAAKIVKETAVPPEWLYHGTSPAAARLILVQGLRPMQRQYVHLSLDVATAVTVGHRKARPPVVLKIAAGEAHLGGVHFYPSHDEVWLADLVPPQYISILEAHDA